jgi:hypothetical protein
MAADERTDLSRYSDSFRLLCLAWREHIERSIEATTEEVK